MTVAFIPIGSDELPIRCMQKIGERPLLERVITLAQKAGCFDRVVVGTNVSEIMHMARNYKAESFSQKLSESKVNTPAEKPLTRFLVENPDVERVTILMYAAPLLQKKDVLASLEMLGDGCDSSFGAFIASWKPQWTMEFKPMFSLARRPDPSKKPTHYVDNESIYSFELQGFHRTGLRHGEASRPYVMPLHRSFKYNSADDLFRIQRMLL